MNTKTEYDLGFASLGNGLSVFNRSKIEAGDYQTVAHISPQRDVKFYVDLPAIEADQVRFQAIMSDPSASTTQPHMKVFHVSSGEAGFVDLFQNFEQLPESVQGVLGFYLDNDEEIKSDAIESLRQELNGLGFTIDINPEGKLHALRNIRPAKQNTVEDRENLYQVNRDELQLHLNDIFHQMEKSYAWNIDSVVMEFAKSHGLDFVSTGGGFDFIYFKCGEGDSPSFIIQSFHSGAGPDSLEEPALLGFNVDNEWLDQNYYVLPTVREAITALANPDFRAAAVWEGRHLIDQNVQRTDEFIAHYHEFTDAFADLTKDLDLTADEASKVILEAFRAVPESKASKTVTMTF